MKSESLDIPPRDYPGLPAALERNGSFYMGAVAGRAIIARLAWVPKARALAARVCDYFGNFLIYHENEEYPSSFYELNMGGISSKFQYARIDLQLGTDRITEALCHELLHLDMAIQGYPFPVKTFIPVESMPFARLLMGMQAIAINLLGHEIIFKRYLDLGLDRRRFLAALTEFPDYKAIASVGSSSPLYNTVTGYPWWCLEYLRLWLLACNNVDNCFMERTQDCLKWGSQIHSELGHGVERIMDLLRSGTAANMAAFPDFCNMLMETMGLPKYTTWVILERGISGPITRRVQ